MGLPGAGKTTVGRLVANELGATFTDVDQEIERRTGRTIADLFAERGEPAFRRLERRVMDELLAGPPQVIAPGGGWAAREGALEKAGDAALTIHLAVAPQVAAGRLGPADNRPLLAGDPLARLTALARVRLPRYRHAAGTVETDGRAPQEVAADVAALARSRGGW